MSDQLTPDRMALIAALAFVLVLLFGVPVIALLKRAGAGQRVRDDGPQRHLQKEGTPTMGGLLIVGAAGAAAVVGQLWLGRELISELGLLLAVTLAFACIGAADDWMKINRGRSLGLRARHKLLLQVIVSVAFAYALVGQRAVEAASGGAGAGPLSPAWALFWVIAMAATSNAVNLADGLDGLASGLCAIAGAGFAVLAVKAGDQTAAVVAISLTGACLGFLVYNRHPARVFMGDVGALALGGGLAALATWLHEPLALIGLCLVPFIEAGSVVIQVISFKATGKRVFKMSPLHHHFELSGWSETRVVVTFWSAALLGAAAAVGVSLLA
ncbi:MAG TPA: phospho-N-acetylmuramoyl-pentapeptide-transferase [Armatimonadota bacterium]|nr:phospho-N-acetylmuramoyl-pentapeptide-transferase [Armatimonadota bacterium]